jgi:hypothetical protein
MRYPKDLGSVFSPFAIIAVDLSGSKEVKTLIASSEAYRKRV